MKMISITLNGERRDIPDGSTVAGIVAISGAGGQQVAVVVNEHIVRPADRETTLLKESDHVEVLVFAGGG
jgi:sulfur carrier protein